MKGWNWYACDLLVTVLPWDSGEEACVANGSVDTITHDMNGLLCK